MIGNPTSPTAVEVLFPTLFADWFPETIFAVGMATWKGHSITQNSEALGTRPGVRFKGTTTKRPFSFGAGVEMQVLCIVSSSFGLLYVGDEGVGEVSKAIWAQDPVAVGIHREGFGKVTQVR